VPLLYEKVSYDPVKDVSPISLAVEDFLGVVVAPNLPVNSLSDFVGLAREKPGQMNFFAVPGVPYLAYLTFQKRAGIETTFVGYSNPGGAMNDMAEGRIHIAVLPLAMTLGSVRSGRMKLIAVTNGARTPVAPDAPSVLEEGYQDLSFGGLLGMFGPKDMSPALRKQIATDLKAVLTDPDTRKRLQDVGLVARGTTPEEFASELDAQRAKWSAVARENNIKPQQPR
jgi:tripartite-type tricarboxylate transporter receptor subunit TctC